MWNITRIYLVQNIIITISKNIIIIKMIKNIKHYFTIGTSFIFIVLIFTNFIIIFIHFCFIKKYFSSRMNIFIMFQKILGRTMWNRITIVHYSLSIGYQTIKKLHKIRIAYPWRSKMIKNRCHFKFKSNIYG